MIATIREVLAFHADKHTPDDYCPSVNLGELKQLVAERDWLQDLVARHDLEDLPINLGDTDPPAAEDYPRPMGVHDPDRLDGLMAKHPSLAPVRFIPFGGATPVPITLTEYRAEMSAEILERVRSATAEPVFIEEPLTDAERDALRHYHGEAIGPDHALYRRKPGPGLDRPKPLPRWAWVLLAAAWIATITFIAVSL